jgi:hypothetical protein
MASPTRGSAARTQDGVPPLSLAPGVFCTGIARRWIGWVTHRRCQSRNK